MTVHAAIDRMRAVADLWGEASHHLRRGQEMTGPLTMAEHQTGIFSGLVSAYEPVLRSATD